MSFSSLLKRWFGKRQAAIRNRKKPHATIRLQVEQLEGRVVATASISLVSGVLSVGDTLPGVIIYVETVNTNTISVSLEGDTFSAGTSTTAPTGFPSQSDGNWAWMDLSGNSGSQTAAEISISTVALSTNAFSLSASGSEDVVFVDLGASYFQNVTITAQPQTYNAVALSLQGTVQLDSLNVGNSLTVTAPNVSITGPVQATNSVSINAGNVGIQSLDGVPGATLMSGEVTITSAVTYLEGTATQPASILSGAGGANITGAYIVLNESSISNTYLGVPTTVEGGGITLKGTGLSEFDGTVRGGDGVDIEDSSTISVYSSNLNITGNGAFGGSGVVVSEGSSLAATDGSVTITGTGAPDSDADASTEYGVSVESNSSIAVTGGDLAVTGTGGAGTGNDNEGVYVAYSGQVSGGTAGATITGTGNGTGDDEIGVDIEGGVSASASGPITIKGTGSPAGTDSNDGVLVSDAILGSSGIVTTVDGSLSITGTGGGQGADNYGIAVTSSGLVQSTGGAVSLTGTGGDGTGDSNEGVYVSGAQVQAESGGATITGTGSGTGDDEDGVDIENGSLVSAGAGGPITVKGTASPAGTDDNEGVLIQGAASTSVITVGGALGITGVGGGYGVGNVGVDIEAGPQISSSTGAITITGTGGAGPADTGTAPSPGDNIGVLAAGSTPTVQSTGAVTIKGTGGSGSGNDNDAGVFLAYPLSATLATDATGSATSPSPGAVSVDGTGPATVQAGVAFTVTADIDDTTGADSDFSGAATLTDSVAGSLSSPATGTISNGVLTLTGVTLTAFGAQTLDITTDAFGTPLQIAEFNITVIPTSLVVSVAPTNPTTAGASFNMTITAENKNGSVATGFDGAATITDSATQSLTSPDTATFSNGVLTLTGVTLTKSGSQKLTIASNGLKVTTDSIMVDAATAQSFAVVPAAATATAGTSFTVTVTAKDLYGNTADFTGDVALSDTLNGIANAVTGFKQTVFKNGVATLSGVVLDTAGSQTLTVTADATASVPGISGTGTVIVDPAAANEVVLDPASAAPPASLLSVPSSFTMTVDVEDRFGNLVTGFAKTAKITDSLTGALISPQSAVFSDGKLTLNITLSTASTTAQVITVSAAGVPNSYKTPAVSVDPIFVLSEPSTVTAGTPFRLTVTAEDASGSILANMIGPIHLISTDPQATNLGTFLFTAVDNGVLTINGIVLKTAGSTTITVEGGTYTGTTTLTVSPAPSPYRAPVGPAESGVVGQTYTQALQATVTDKYGNPIAGVAVTFTAPASGASGMFGASRTATAFTNADGVATAPVFTANTKAGRFVVTLSAHDAPLGSLVLTNLPGPAAELKVVGSATRVTTLAGILRKLEVEVTDQYGNVIADEAVTFSVPVNGSTGTFAGQTTATVSTNAAGIAVAPPLKANAKRGTFTVTATVEGLTANFDVTIG